MENTKNRNSGSNNEPEYGSRHSRNRSADASGNSAHGARSAAGTRARKVPHGVESDGLDTRAAAPARGISHEEKRRRQNRRDIFSSLGILLLIALLGFCGYTAYRFTCVDSFIVSGSGRYSAEQIIGLAGLQTGRHILSYNTDEISKNVSSIPNLICTGVRRVFPNKISINVADHNAAAAIPAANGTYTLIDAEGLVLAIGAESSGELILLRGMANIGFVHNTVITEKNHCLRTVTAMKLLAAVKECGIAESVIAIDVSNAASIKLELQHGYTFVLDDWRYAEGNIKTAAKAYKRLLPVYPSGGTVNIFKDSTVVDFTPRSSAASVPPETDAPQQVTAPPNSTDEP